MINLKRKQNAILIISAIAGFIAVFVFRRNLSAEASVANYLGYMSMDLINTTMTVESIREIFSIPIVGFIYFDFFDIVNVFLISILFIPVLYFCYIKNKFNSFLGAILLLSCSGMYLISNMTLPFFNNLENSDELIRIINQYPRYELLNDISIFILYFFGFYITVSMKSLNHFSKYTFAFGLLTNITGLLYFPLILLIGEMNYIAIVIAAPFTIIWHMNIAINLLKIEKANKDVSR